MHTSVNAADEDNAPAQACSGCRFWNKRRDAQPEYRGPRTNIRAEEAIGLCQRFPSEVTKRASKWCGEFQPKPAGQPQADAAAAELSATREARCA